MMDWLTPVLVAIAGIVGGLFEKVRGMLKERREARQKERRDALVEWQDLTSALKKVINQSQIAMEALQDDNSELRELVAEYRQCLLFIYGDLCRVHQAAIDKDKPGPLIKMPILRDYKPKHNVDFLIRQAVQGAELVNVAISPNNQANNVPQANP
jgi:hypothetical protein